MKKSLKYILIFRVGFTLFVFFIIYLIINSQDIVIFTEYRMVLLILFIIIFFIVPTIFILTVIYLNYKEKMKIKGEMQYIKEKIFKTM